MSISIGFFGGTQGVTGSCFLLNIRGTQILIDCGLFQGLESEKKLFKISL